LTQHFFSIKPWDGCETNIHSKTIINKAWSQAEGRFDHSFVFAFQTKAEYLEFRRCWKAGYAALSQSIRGLKAAVKVNCARERKRIGQRGRDKGWQRRARR